MAYCTGGRLEKLFDWADVEGLDLEKSKVRESGGDCPNSV